MTKKGKLGLSALLIIVLLVGFSLFLAATAEKVVFSQSFQEQVLYSASAAEIHTKVHQFTLEKDGSYRVNAEWNSEPEGVLTGLVIRNAAGEIQNYNTADWCRMNYQLELKKGTYDAAFYFMTNDGQSEKFFDMVGSTKVMYDAWDADQPTHTVKVACRLTMLSPGVMGNSQFYAVLVTALGIIVGLILAGITLVATSKDGKLKRNYDERQQLIRGKGTQFSFFTMLVCNLLFAFLFMCLEKPPVTASVALGLSVMLAITVYACYCIWNEGYFALNEAPKLLIAFFAGLGVLNLLVFAVNALQGYVIVDGVITFNALNLLWAVMIAILLTVMLLKRLQGKREGN